MRIALAGLAVLPGLRVCSFEDDGARIAGAGYGCGVATIGSLPFPTIFRLSLGARGRFALAIDGLAERGASSSVRKRVALAGCASYEPEAVRSALRRMLAPWGGMGAFVGRGERVLLKPNMIVARPAESAVTTHPEVVRAVALEVVEAGAIPFIGDSPAFGSAASVARVCGLEAVALELGLEIVDLGGRPCARRTAPYCPFSWLSYGSAALEASAIVNLPKVKAHCQMGLSLGIKNLFGAVAGKRKALLHFRTGDNLPRFSRMIVAVAQQMQPTLTIEDGIIGLERDGPTQGDPRAMGFLAAGDDVTAVDRVVMEILGYALEEVPYVHMARQEGMGEANMRFIEVVGETIEALRVRDYVRVTELSPIGFSLPRVVRSMWRQAGLLLRDRRAG